ncbi:MAG: GDP-mannose 4,6-dehydratase [Pseudomonadota bacterium]
MTAPIALITGITGQDGSYLTELLLEKGYVVHGIVRRSSTMSRQRIDHLTSDPEIYGQSLFLHYADLSDITTLRRIIGKVQPDEFYHLAGQSHVGLSFDIPESTSDFTAMGTLRILEILRDQDHPIRFLNVGSSEIFGRPAEAPQTENTAMRPVSPYGVAKAFAVNMTRVYRDSFNMFCCNAICYNHESPRRGSSFVTRKIARGVARILKAGGGELALGNLDAERDWGYAPEYVHAMWLTLQNETAEDFILATGQSSSLKTFLSKAFNVAGLNWEDHVVIDPRFVRPTEPTSLIGNPTKASQLLSWRAETDVSKLAEIMVKAEIKNLIIDDNGPQL